MGWNTLRAELVTTYENGDYRMPSLPVGAYEVKDEILGFNPLILSLIELAVAQEVVLNLTLEVGTTEEQVTLRGGECCGSDQPTTAR